MASQDQANNKLNNGGQEKDVIPTIVSFREDTETVPTFIFPEGHHSPDDLSEVNRQFDISSADFQDSSLQQRRMSLFDYTPFSLPPSRVRFPHTHTYKPPPPSTTPAYLPWGLGARFAASAGPSTVRGFAQQILICHGFKTDKPFWKFAVIGANH